MAKPKTVTKPPAGLRKRSKNNQPWHQSSSAKNVAAFAILAILLVYASTFFTGNKGSQTHKGKSTPKKPAVKEEAAKHASKDKVLAEDPSIPKIQPPAKQLWQRTETGANKGMITLEDVKPGTLLIYGLPLVTVPANQNKTSPTVDILNAINKLSATDKEAYFNLPYNAFKLEDDASQEAMAINIWEANAVHAGATSSIFVDPAYIQHSCLPNADYFYREDISALVVHAVRPIAKGEEITCPYFDASVLTREERQEHMHTTRGNACSCQACAYEGAKLEESDKNRKRLGEIKKSIQAYGLGEEEPETVLENIEEAYKLLKEEDYKAE